MTSCNSCTFDLLAESATNQQHVQSIATDATKQEGHAVTGRPCEHNIIHITYPMQPLLESVGKLLRLGRGPQLFFCRLQPAWHSSAQGTGASSQAAWGRSCRGNCCGGRWASCCRRTTCCTYIAKKVWVWGLCGGRDPLQGKGAWAGLQRLCLCQPIFRQLMSEHTCSGYLRHVSQLELDAHTYSPSSQTSPDQLTCAQLCR